MQISDIFASLLIAVIVFEISTTIHEFAHMLMCKSQKCRIIGMKVLFLYYNGHKWTFRLRGKNHCAFATSDKRKMKKVVCAGPIAETIVAICSLLSAMLVQMKFIRVGFIFATVLIVISIIINLLPITDGDGKMLFEKERD